MEKRKKQQTILMVSALAMLILAAAVLILMLTMQVSEIRLWYDEIQQRLLDFEQRVMSIDNKWLFLIALILLVIIKAYVPILSVSALCLITGAFFSGYWAIAINTLLCALLFTIKYYWGARFGGGNALKFLNKYDYIHDVLEHNGYGNPWLLFVLRLTPSFPINSVSRLYGAMGLNYRKYLLLSLAGFLPKLLSYTLIGRNVFDPLSPSFLLPIIIFFSFSGLFLLSLNGVLAWIYRGKKYADDSPVDKDNTEVNQNG